MREKNYNSLKAKILGSFHITLVLVAVIWITWEKSLNANERVPAVLNLEKGAVESAISFQDSTFFQEELSHSEKKRHGRGSKSW